MSKKPTTLMSTLQLSTPAQQTINDYLHLPLPHSIPCPYFNNRRLGARGNLRVLIGKGTPEEIAEEAKILALKEKVELEKLSEESLLRFLVDHGLGVECSGFVYHVIGAELKARDLGSLARHLIFPQARNSWRKFITRFRPAENTNVRVLADEANSAEVSLADIQPGDMIAFLNAGQKHDRDHVLLIDAVERTPLESCVTPSDGNDNENLKSNPRLELGSREIKNLKFVHSFQWRIDGKYNHGVRRGSIEMTGDSKPLIEQRWIENGKEGVENETLEHAKTAESVRIIRLKALNSAR